MEEQTFNPNKAEMPRNSEIRRSARYALKGNWTQAVLATLVFSLITAAAGSIPFAGLLVVCPLEFGFMLCFLRLIRGEDSSEMVGDQFSVFSKYGRTLGTSLLMTLYILLWCLLFVIPGIIMSYAYAMTPYVMNDRPDLDPREPHDDERLQVETLLLGPEFHRLGDTLHLHAGYWPPLAAALHRGFARQVLRGAEGPSGIMPNV